MLTGDQGQQAAKPRSRQELPDRRRQVRRRLGTPYEAVREKTGSLAQDAGEFADPWIVGHLATPCPRGARQILDSAGAGGREAYG